MKIYHNPRCLKSRQTLALLQEQGIEPEIILYLDSALTIQELSSLLIKLEISPEQLVRKGEVIWKEKFKGKEIIFYYLVQRVMALGSIL